jgi:mono/diheme cytochrome c family protein
MMIKKILLGIVIVVIMVVLGFIGFVNFSYDKDYSDEYPVPDLKVEIDSAKIERGRYLAHGPAHCVDCHAPLNLVLENEGEKELAFSGGFGMELPPGIFYAPNITPDEETGIGRYSDGELYRMLRYNIRPKGTATIDFMPFFNMSDADIYAIIAYLRSQEKVKNQMPESEFTFLGKMLLTMGVIKPSVPDEPILKSVNEDTTAEYGKYLSYAVANCRGCHTDRDLKSGEFIGIDYAGGMVFGPDSFTKDWVFVSPNLTPDEETGIMDGWDEEFFIDRIRAGRAHETSPMPWGAFQRFNDNDLKAIWRYLSTLKPVDREVAEIARPPQQNE